MYAGHRSGCIKVWDLRRQRPVVAMQEHKVKGVPSSVIDIHLLLDDNYFVCSAFNSKVGREGICVHVFSMPIRIKFSYRHPTLHVHIEFTIRGFHRLNT